MNTNTNPRPVRITDANRASLAARLRHYRKAGALALLSVGTIRALSAVESRAAERLTRQIVSTARTNDAITDEEIAGAVSRIELTADTLPAPYALTGALLSGAERDRLAVELGRKPRAVVFRDVPAPARAPAKAIRTPAEITEDSRGTMAEYAYRKALAELAARRKETARLSALFARPRPAVALAPAVRAMRQAVSEHAAFVAKARAMLAAAGHG